MAAKKQKKTPTPKRRPGDNIKLDFIVPDDMVCEFADNLLVIHTQNEFVLSFMQTRFPTILKPEDVHKLTTVESVCISRIIVTPAMMEQMITALQTNFDKYKAAHQKAGK